MRRVGISGLPLHAASLGSIGAMQLGLLLVLGVCMIALRARVRRAAPSGTWDCGYARPTAPAGNAGSGTLITIGRSDLPAEVADLTSRHVNYDERDAPPHVTAGWHRDRVTIELGHEAPVSRSAASPRPRASWSTATSSATRGSCAPPTGTPAT